MNREPEIKKTVLEKITVSAARHLPYFGGNLIPEVDHAVDSLILRIRAEMLGKHVQDHIFPADWWQAVKDRWFPAWLKKRCPVRYIVISRTAVYPELSIPGAKLVEEVFTWINPERTLK